MGGGETQLAISFCGFTCRKIQAVLTMKRKTGNGTGGGGGAGVTPECGPCERLQKRDPKSNPHSKGFVSTVL